MAAKYRSITSNDQRLPVIRQLLYCLIALLSLTPEFALASSTDNACQVGAGGRYLRADGQAGKRWSVKAPDQPIVYVERCLIDQLLSYFPESMQKLGYGDAYQLRALRQPAVWSIVPGSTILTLSPASRFQVAAAILYVESEFHPNVSPSSAGAIGPFQVMPTTGDQMGLPRLDKRSENLKAGLKYILYIEEQIARHCDFAEQSKEGSSRYQALIAASYHAGPNYLSKQDENGSACRLEAFPKVTRTEYLSRFNRAMGFRFLPATLRYKPS